MKWSLWIGVLLLAVAVGCKKEADQGGDSPAAPQTSGDNGGDTGGDATSTDESSSATDSSAGSDVADTEPSTQATGQGEQVGPGEQAQPEQTAGGDSSSEPTDTETAPDALAEDGGEQQPETPTKREYIRRVRQAFLARQMDEAISILQEALEQYPNDMDVIASLISVRLRHGMDLQQQGDLEAAAEQFRQAIALAHQTFDGKEVPDNMRSLWQAVVFAEAQVAAHDGNVDETIAALNRAVEAGWQDLSALDEDPFFAKIKDDPKLTEARTSLAEAIRQRMIQEVREQYATFESFPFNFELPNLDGETVRLSDFKGKVVIVDFWGTWCPPCRMEIPHFVQLQQEFPDDLQIVGINYEGDVSDEATAKIRTFATENGINYPLVIGDEATQKQVPNFEGYPTTLFIDREGNVRLKVVGYHPYEMLKLYVEELVNEGKTEPQT